MEGKHRRRSSLTEALSEDLPLEFSGNNATAEESKVHEEEEEQDAAKLEAKASGVAPVRSSSPTHASSEAIEISGAGQDAEESPFTPDDSPSYELCPEAPRRSTSSSASLHPVPEEAPSPPAEGEPQLPPLRMVAPDALSLPPVRTPRRMSTDVEPVNRVKRSSGSTDEAYSIRFTQQPEGQEALAFNPFADSQDAISFAASPQAVMSPTEDGFFSMDIDGQTQQQLQPDDLPFVAHLDFGARNGSGVVGPKIDSIAGGRLSDKFEVKEGEDAEIKQLLWVIENLQEELHQSSAAMEQAEGSVQDCQAVVSRLQDEYQAAEAAEVELEEELRVLHSKLEAQLLAKLDQEEELRMSGDKLKAVKAEVVMLDESLAAAEEERRELERQAAQKRATAWRETHQKSVGGRDNTVQQGSSPNSNYSSAWETSDSEEEALDLRKLDVPRQSASISEDNQAKLKEKGGLSGSWLRSVLGGRSKKELEAPVLSAAEATSPEATKKSEVIGAGHSHFEQPATAAELAPEPEEPAETQPESQP